ncbi:MAG: hypothetical protein HUU37_10340, partial [Bdellovibrionales bacterium]|nr:hypothetical protein [Bdellovibrionales bacterium]
VEMLRAMGFLQMCIYDEVEREGAVFTERFQRTGLRIKDLLERNGDNTPRALVELFTLGMQAMKAKPQHGDPVYQIMNRFVRSPYFVSLVFTGDHVRRELAYLNGIGTAGQRGLGGFLRDVLVWRWQTAQELGGKFVRDRLATEYHTLQSNVATMDIVKLELLRKARYRTEQSFASNTGEDVWGEKKRGSLPRPEKRDDQYHWDFNGEFWADELGDYVFALRPECGE